MKFKKLLIIFTSIVFVFALGGLSFLYYLKVTLPDIAVLEEYEPSIPSQILSKDGEVLLEAGSESRDVAEISEIPEIIKNAFIAAEDDNFYSHSGFDYKGFARAMMKNVAAGRLAQGGSTITQQVAKLLLLSREKKIIRKLRDILLAFEIEKKFSKDQILYFYLNQIYLGSGFYGVKQAVKGYFDKELDEVNLAEASLLAGLLVAPTKYSPKVNPKYAKLRHEYVLKRLFETGKITQKEYEEAKNSDLRIKVSKSHAFKGGHFTEWVKQKFIEEVGEEKFLKSGFKIVTTIDWGLQQKAEEYVRNGLDDIDKRQGFSGPISKLSEEEFSSYREKFVRNILKSSSEYFLLKPDGYNEFELEKNFEIVERMYQDWRASFDKSTVVGYDNKNPLIKNLDQNEKLKAVVLHCDDLLQIVYVSVGGVVGIIPQNYFAWARPREISEDRNYYPEIKRPSQILKKNDIILVKIKSTKTTIWSHLSRSIRSRVSKKKELIKSLKSEKFLLLSLESDPEVEGALLAVDVKTGEVVSFVGGRDFRVSQFNRVVQSYRQPGSAFKPILYAMGLENGYTAATVLNDSPESLGGVDDSLSWKPNNYDKTFLGPITFRRSLELSRNVTTIKLAMDLGISNVVKFLDRLGFEAKMNEDLSLALGSFGSTLKNMVYTYAIFPNGGKKVGPKSIIKIIDRDGNQVPIGNFDPLVEEKKESPEVLEQKKNDDLIAEDKVEDNMFLKDLDSEQVYDERLAFIMNNLLRGVVLNGTGRGARSAGSFIGGKTGTTSNYIDAWFIGFSSKIALGVWTGFDNNQTMGYGETGSKSALPIWRDYMKATIDKFGEKDFVQPKGIVNVVIEPEVSPSPKMGSRKYIESFAIGTEPGASNSLESKDPPSEGGQIFEDDDYYQ